MDGVPEEPDAVRKGVILNVSIKNFMTFGSDGMDNAFVFDFGPHINIMSGPNGVGKSSIVTAIMLCCGASASFIARTSSNRLTDLVKRGAEYAEIEIALCDPLAKDGMIRFKKKFFATKGKPDQYFIDGANTLKKNYLLRLTDFRIKGNNLTQFLPQEQVAEFSNLSPSARLKHTEEALGADVQDMHEELMEHREQWLKIEKELDEIKRSLEHSLEPKEELDREKATHKRKVEKAEKLLAIRAKMMATELTLLRSQFARMESAAKRREELRKSNVVTVKRVHKDLYTDSLKPGRPTKKPADIARLIRPVTNALAKNTEKTEQSGKITQDRDAAMNDPQEVAYLTELQGLKEDIDFLENSLDRDGSVVVLHDKQVELEDKIGKIREDLQEAERAEEMMRMYKLECRKRLRQLINDKALEPDVLHAWQWLLENYPKKVIGPLFFYIWPKTDEYIPQLEGAFAKVLPHFLCEDKETLFEVFYELKAKQELNVSLIGPMQPRQNHLKEISQQDRIMAQRMGFTKVISDLFETIAPVKEFLYSYAKIGTTLTGPRLGDRAASNLVRWYHQYDSSLMRSLDGVKLKFFTSDSQWEDRGPSKNSLDNVFVTSLPDPKMLDFPASQLHRNNERERFQAQQIFDRIKANHDIQTLEIIKALKALLKETEEKIADTASKIVLAQQNAVELERKRKELNELTQRDRKPVTAVVDAFCTQLRFLRQEQLKLLCSDVNHSNLKTISTTVSERVDSALEIIGQLSNMANSYRYLTRMKPQKNYLETLLKNDEVKMEETADKMKAAEQRLREFIQNAFLDRRKKPSDVKTMVGKEDLINKNSLEELVALAGTAWNDYIIEQPNYQRIARLQQVVVDDYNRLVKEREEKQFSLRKSQVSSTFLRQQWVAKVDGDLAVMNKRMMEMLEKIDYAGQLELISPPDENRFDEYGIDMKVGYHDGEETVRLTRYHQSGGERVVATAVYLMALQSCSDVPFRIVDEINQGMDCVNERKVFQLLIATANNYNAQYISVSPKMIPEFESGNPRLNFCFPMKARMCSDDGLHLYPASAFSVESAANCLRQTEEEYEEEEMHEHDTTMLMD